MNLSGTLMSGDTPVAKIRNGNIKPIEKHLMPIYLQRTENFEHWLESRAIDRHRTNSRLLKKALRLTNTEDAELVLKVNAATITDNYWFAPEGSNLKYNDVKFKRNMFDKLALYGDPDSFNHTDSHTPELTNIGSYEKCWRIIDGKWWMYKQGNESERFSEMFIYYLGEKLGFKMAHYEQENGYVKSLDFTNGAEVNYEPMYSFVGEDDEYADSFKVLFDINPQIADDYIKMIYLDTICFNVDRHTQNYGVLRNTSTGEIISLAPNFDNNIALISRGYPKNIERTNDKLIEFFSGFVNQNPNAREMYEAIDKSMLTQGTVLECIADTGFDVNKELITKFILNGVRATEEMILDQGQQQGITLQ